MSKIDYDAMQLQQLQLEKELKRMGMGFSGNKMEEKLALYQAQEKMLKDELKRQAQEKFDEEFRNLNTTIPDISPSQLRTKERVTGRKVEPLEVEIP